MSNDDIDEFYDELFEPGTGPDAFSELFVSRYEPIRYIESGALNRIDSGIGSAIVENYEPIAVADTDNEDLTIEVYERHTKSVLELPWKLTGKLDDFILHVAYEPGEKASKTELGHSTYIFGNFRGFGKDDAEEIMAYLDSFSTNGFKTNLRARDLELDRSMNSVISDFLGF